MFEAEHALGEHLEYCQIGPNHWKATYRGFITLSAEGKDPRNTQHNLYKAFDLFLANLIRTSHDAERARPDVIVKKETGARAGRAVRRLSPRR
jgi:hypothetical protein